MTCASCGCADRPVYVCVTTEVTTRALGSVKWNAWYCPACWPLARRLIDEERATCAAFLRGE